MQVDSSVGRRGLGILAVGVLIGGVLTTGTMKATEVAASSILIVDSVADTVDPGDGALTLREAITTANTRNGTTVSFSLPDPATITLTSSLPEIKKPVTISGPGEASLTIDSATFRPFFINGGNTTITDLSLTGAPPAIAHFGSLIHNTKATTILQRITVENVTMMGSAWGTLIYNKESNSFLTIQDSTYRNNSADDSSYLIQANHGSTDSGVPADNVVTIEGSTFVDNEDFITLRAQRTMIVRNSTFLRNYQAASFVGSGNHEFHNNRIEANSLGAEINPWKNDARGWFFHNTVTDNQFINNAGYGLSTSVTAPATATITGNTFSGNSPDLLYNGSSTVPSGIAATNTFVAGPIPALSSSSVPFGSMSVGATSADSSITFSNTGGSSLTINVGGITIAGGDDTDYMVTGGTCSAGATVTAGGSCTIDLAFAPTQSGARSATLTVATSAGSVAAALSGTGLSAPPTPVPAVPASAPMDVGATEGDRSLSVSWAAPASAGSFPITHYQVTTRPSSGSCLVSAETTGCLLEGLSNITEYQVRVRALTGAGWGAWSEPVSVTPQPESPQTSILISGARSQGVVQVVGEVVDGEIDSATVWARMPGQAHYSAQQEVRTTRDGQRFTWQMATRKRVYVFVRATLPGGQQLRSNRIIIPRFFR